MTSSAYNINAMMRTVLLYSVQVVVFHFRGSSRDLNRFYRGDIRLFVGCRELAVITFKTKFLGCKIFYNKTEGHIIFNNMKFISIRDKEIVNTISIILVSVIFSNYVPTSVPVIVRFVYFPFFIGKLRRIRYCSQIHVGWSTLPVFLVGGKRIVFSLKGFKLP